MGKFKVGDRIRTVKGFFSNNDKNIVKEGVILDIQHDPDWLKITLDNDEDNVAWRMVKPEYIEHISKPKSNETRVIINPPAVILFKDGKKYVAKAQDEPFNAERGLMVAMLRSFGIGYSDLQKMLRDAKYQKNISICKTEYSADELYKKAGMTQDTEIKYPKVVLDAIDELEQKPKKKRGRPRKIVKDETPKPKRPVGRPRKSQLQYKVGDYVLVNGLFYQIKAFSEDKKKAFLYDARNQTITEHDVSEIMRVQK